MPITDTEMSKRLSVNLRIDIDKFEMLESMKKTGFGLAQTERNRSDVYNEVLGYGLQTLMLRDELGTRDFESLWKLINKVDFKKVSLEKIEKFFLG